MKLCLLLITGGPRVTRAAIIVVEGIQVECLWIILLIAFILPARRRRAAAFWRLRRIFLPKCLKERVRVLFILLLLLLGALRRLLFTIQHHVLRKMLRTFAVQGRLLLQDFHLLHLNIFQASGHPRGVAHGRAESLEIQRSDLAASGPAAGRRLIALQLCVYLYGIHFINFAHYALTVSKMLERFCQLQ